jgi:hypothetical protein
MTPDMQLNRCATPSGRMRDTQRHAIAGFFASDLDLETA